MGAAGCRHVLPETENEDYWDIELVAQGASRACRALTATAWPMRSGPLANRRVVFSTMWRRHACPKRVWYAAKAQVRHELDVKQEAGSITKWTTR